jgi:hypothetical protein
MRFYSFTNWMLRPIQQGIQPGHAAVELFVKYHHSSVVKILYDWAENYKTFMCMNGGNNADLLELWSFVDDINNPYPYAAFYEDEQSLNGTMTSIGIVLPEKIYVTAEFERKSQSSNFIKLPETVDSWSWHSWVATIIDSKGNWKEYIFSDWEKELIERLNKTGLAT